MRIFIGHKRIGSRTIPTEIKSKNPRRRRTGADDLLGGKMLGRLWRPAAAYDGRGCRGVGDRGAFSRGRTKKFVVKDDGGVKNATASFAFGEVCYSSEYLKTWFVVMRIVGDQVLVESECIPTVLDDACPNGTETNLPLVQARSGLNAYAADRDKQFMVPRFGTPRE